MDSSVIGVCQVYMVLSAVTHVHPTVQVNVTNTQDTVSNVQVDFKD